MRQVTVISDLLQFCVENPSHKHLLHVAFMRTANGQLVFNWQINCLFRGNDKPQI